MKFGLAEKVRGQGLGDEWSGKGMSNVTEVLVNGWVYEALELLRCHAPPAEVTSPSWHAAATDRDSRGAFNPKPHDERHEPSLTR